MKASLTYIPTVSSKLASWTVCRLARLKNYEWYLAIGPFGRYAVYNKCEAMTSLQLRLSALILISHAHEDGSLYRQYIY